MPPSLDVQELAIVVAASNHTPLMLTPEFLRCSGMIPSDWELARPPVVNPQVAQIGFQNGVSLMAQADRIMFIETLGTKALSDVAVASVAQKYTEALPNADYQAAGINLRGFVPFPADEDAARQYLMKTLLAPGPWQEFGQEPVRASLNFSYRLERGRMSLSVSEAAIQLPEGQTTPIVMFSGNFEYGVADRPESARPAKLRDVFENWQTDLESFKELINHRFLGDSRSLWNLSTPEVLAIGA